MTKTMSRLISGAAATVVFGAGILAALGAAQALESKPLVATPGSQAETRVLVAQAEAAKVSFTAEQVERGKKVFNDDCVECHGKDLRGGLLGGPPLRGVSFEAKYGKGAPAGALYEVMQGTMPPQAPGSYSASVYADLMAHILKTNGFKAGATPLPADVDALYNLVIEK